MSWENYETTPLDMSKENLTKMMDDLRNQKPQPDHFIVCNEDWEKISQRASENNISHFHAYLELLKEGKVRFASG